MQFRHANRLTSDETSDIGGRPGHGLSLLELFSVLADAAGVRLLHTKRPPSENIKETSLQTSQKRKNCWIGLPAVGYNEVVRKIASWVVALSHDPRRTALR